MPANTCFEVVFAQVPDYMDIYIKYMYMYKTKLLVDKSKNAIYIYNSNVLELTGIDLFLTWKQYMVIIIMLITNISNFHSFNFNAFICLMHLDFSWKVKLENYIRVMGA